MTEEQPLGWLTGWKEIAAYIGVSPGVAYHYHIDFHMPVYRKIGRVRALPHELDVWLAKLDEKTTAKKRKSDENLRYRKY